MVKRLFLVAAISVACAAGPPQRIISTSPSVTETLYALGLGARVVGVTTYCHYPPDALKKPKIGAYLNPSLETIVSLRPDLVISEVTGVRRSEGLAALKLRTIEVNDGSIAGLYESIRRIGEATGAQPAASALATKIRAALDDVKRRTSRFPPRRVVFVVGRAPGRLDDLVVAGKNSYLDEVMAIAGGANVFRDTVAPYTRITLEELIARNPEAVVDMGEMAQTVGVTEAEKRAVVALWRRFPSLAAVKQGRVFAVASDYFVVPGPRVVDAAREFARMFHPEAGR